MKKTTQLIKSKKTVFCYDELQNIFSLSSKKATDQFLFRAKKDGDLLNPIKGIRTLPVYDHKELACMLKKNSYISLETVLYDFGVIFQAYFHSVTCVANQSISYNFNDRQYSYSKIKDDILNNDLGIKTYDNYRIAMPERALCDYIYLHPTAPLDNPEIFNKADSLVRLRKFLSLYPKKTKEHIRKVLKLSEKDL